MRYRKVSTQIWNDAKFRELSDRGKLVFLFLLTHPQMTSLGAIRATLSGLAAELHWSEQEFREAFRELQEQGMVEMDEASALIVLPNFIKHNQPENPNVVKSYLAVLELLPECKLLDAYLERVHRTLRKEYAKPFRNGMPIPEPEQKHEQEQNPDPPMPKAPPQNGKRAAVPASVGSLLASAIGDSVSEQMERLVSRVVTVTGEKADWWRDTLWRLTKAGGDAFEFERTVKYVEDCMNPETQRAKDLGDLNNPGGYLFKKLTDLCKISHVTWHKYQKRAPT